jgi:DUF4097 and DUF4098 domain-containing protein YvlB
VITLNANTQGAGEHPVTTDLDVSVPRKAPVVITSRRGDVSVLGRDGDVEIASQHGDVAASDINGKLVLNLSSASARVSNISGDVSVQGRGDDISLADVKGAARISASSIPSSWQDRPRSASNRPAPTWSFQAQR